MRPLPPPLMLFAAGFGTRMGALTAQRPKPLIPVAGRPLIDHALAIADAAGVGRIVANTHYLADQIAAHLAPRGIALSAERERILETGGGLKAALPLLGESPVLTLNTDAVWTGRNPLSQLMAAWDGARMDGLLLLLPAAQARGHHGTGDFLVDDEGRLTRAMGAPAPVYLGAQMLRTEGLAGIGETVFSLNLLWDRMIAAGRLFGVIHDGGWCDVGRPEGIAEAEAMLQGAA
ncbi:nucleotidyltransferase family protein [Paragemmobacter ruber]|uniref:NTP transferase domain-containing protein n=1 Tax=Paragemmobacter ruber TaxID=1985673 RepID=A0ABW9Y432_9RHOB|nr:nucleotidyltransferase family protein [Rhodobacter ruber]NBE07291.1 NTP transferase domain-containing protein [Rhodobacter ruber]